MLTMHVALIDDRGVLQQFGPGDDVPDWARARITNPRFWDSSASVEEVPDVDGPPPRSGKGSGEGPWRAYAAAKKVDVSSAEGRDDIIGLLRDAGVAVE